MAALSRFLLEQMYREDSSRASLASGGASSNSTSASSASTGAGGKDAAAAAAAKAKGARGGRGAAAAAAAAAEAQAPSAPGAQQQPSAFAAALESTLGLSYRSRMQCVQGAPDMREREGRAFQVDLQYPMSRERAAKQAQSAREAGLARLPGAIQAGPSAAAGGGGAGGAAAAPAPMPRRRSLRCCLRRLRRAACSGRGSMRRASISSYGSSACRRHCLRC